MNSLYDKITVKEKYQAVLYFGFSLYTLTVKGSLMDLTKNGNTKLKTHCTIYDILLGTYARTFLITGIFILMNVPGQNQGFICYCERFYKSGLITRSPHVFFSIATCHV